MQQKSSCIKYAKKESFFDLPILKHCYETNNDTTTIKVLHISFIMEATISSKEVINYEFSSPV
jgi:hypothetical protein